MFLIAFVLIGFIIIIELNFQIESSIKDLMVKSRSPAFTFLKIFPFPQCVLMFFIYNLLVQAFGEEFFFRGFILKELLNRIREYAAIAISALFFGRSIYHFLSLSRDWSVHFSLLIVS